MTRTHRSLVAVAAGRHRPGRAARMSRRGGLAPAAACRRAGGDRRRRSPSARSVYPDLVSVIPATDLAISQPTRHDAEFNYEHIMYNAGRARSRCSRSTTTRRPNLRRRRPEPLLVRRRRQPGARAAGAGAPTSSSTTRSTATSTSRWPSFGLYSVKADGSHRPAGGAQPEERVLHRRLAHARPEPRPAATATPAPPAATRPRCAASHPVVVTSTTGSIRARPSTSPGWPTASTGSTRWPIRTRTSSTPTGPTTSPTSRCKIVGTTVTPLSSVVSQGNFVIDQSAVVDGAGPAVDRRRSPRRARVS